MHIYIFISFNAWVENMVFMGRFKSNLGLLLFVFLIIVSGYIGYYFGENENYPSDNEYVKLIINGTAPINITGAYIEQGNLDDPSNEILNKQIYIHKSNINTTYFNGTVSKLSQIIIKTHEKNGFDYSKIYVQDVVKHCNECHNKAK